jgi:hypothetical protein
MSYRKDIHGAGNHGLQISQTEIIQGIQRVSQTVVKILDFANNAKPVNSKLDKEE